MALGIRKFSGTGSPEGVVSGPPGAVYIQTNASSASEIWDKATGTGNTINARVPGGMLTDYRPEEITRPLGPATTKRRKKPKSIGRPVPKKKGV